MQENLNNRLKRLEEDIQSMLLIKGYDNNRLRSCPASCEDVSKSCDLHGSRSALSKSISAPSNARSKENTQSQRKEKRGKKPRDVQRPSANETILNYIESLEKSLSRKVEPDSGTCTSLCSVMSCTNIGYEQSLICGNVLIAPVALNKKRNNERPQSTKKIKKELTKMKRQLDVLEDSKRDAIEITKRVLQKRDTPNGGNRNRKKAEKNVADAKKPQSLCTETQTIKVCESSQTSDVDLTKKDELIKTLKDSNKRLYANVKQQEAKIVQLTKSLQSSQAQLHENRKSFQKYENLLEENMMFAAKMHEFEETLRRKDETNAKILMAAEELAKDLQERDNINRRLNENVAKFETTIVDLGATNKKLMEENRELSDRVKEMESKLEEAKWKYDAVGGKIDDFKEQMQRSQLEIGRLRAMVSSHGKQDLSKEKDMEKLQENLRDHRTKESKFSDEINNLRKQLQTVKRERDAIGERLEKASRKPTRNQCTMTTFDNVKDQDTNTSDLITCEEIIELRQSMSDNEKHMLKEKEELKGLVQELTSIVKTQKDRIADLNNFSRQQEQMLDVQTQNVNSKEREIEESQRTVNELTCRCTSLENEIANLRSQLNRLHETKANEPENAGLVENSIKALVKQLDDTMSMLNDEKDCVRIKEKIIESQTLTIDQMRSRMIDKEEEICKADAELRKLLSDLTQTAAESDRIRVELEEEKRSKETMYEDIQRLQKCKEDLLVKFNRLEMEFREYYANANSANAETSCDHEEIIDALQTQLKQQETEWLQNSQMLLHEKEKAVVAAKFATQKLIDTMNKMTSELSCTRFPLNESFQLQRRSGDDDSDVENDACPELTRRDRSKEMNIYELHSSGDCRKKDDDDDDTLPFERDFRKDFNSINEWNSFGNEPFCGMQTSNSSKMFEDVALFGENETWNHAKALVTPLRPYDKNYVTYNGMQEVKEIFVRQRAKPIANWPTNQFKHSTSGQQNKPIRYFSLLKRDRT